MNGTQSGRDATIYAFPEGGRNRGLVTRPSASTIIRPARFAPTIFAESGWYHDEAMREEVRQGQDDFKPN